MIDGSLIDAMCAWCAKEIPQPIWRKVLTWRENKRAWVKELAPFCNDSCHKLAIINR